MNPEITHLAHPGPRRLRRGFALFVAILLVLIATETTLRLRAYGSSATHGAPAAESAARPEAANPLGTAIGLDAKTTTHVAAGRLSAIRRLADLGLPVYCGAGTKPLVALTFDDGPGPFTRATLRMLREARAPATFFLVGKLIDEARFQGLPRKEAARGAIGDHTWSHVRVTGLSEDGLRAEIGRTRNLLTTVTGERVVLFRPPLGRHDATVDRFVKSLGMVQVLWSLDTRDSDGATAKQILRSVRQGVGPGDIVLLHENRGTTRSVLPEILQLVEKRGLRPVTVPKLLTLDPPSWQQLRSHSCP